MQVILEFFRDPLFFSVRLTLHLHVLKYDSGNLIPQEEKLCGRGIVVGCYETGDSSNKAVELSESGQRLDDLLEGKLLNLMKMSVV